MKLELGPCLVKGLALWVALPHQLHEASTGALVFLLDKVEEVRRPKLDELAMRRTVSGYFRLMESDAKTTSVPGFSLEGTLCCPTMA